MNWFAQVHIRNSDAVRVRASVSCFPINNLSTQVENYKYHIIPMWASLVVQTVENPPAMREIWVGSLGLGRSPGGGHGNPLQHSCLESPTNRGAWWATVHGVAELATTKQLNTAQSQDINNHNKTL